MTLIHPERPIHRFARRSAQLAAAVPDTVALDTITTLTTAATSELTGDGSVAPADRGAFTVPTGRGITGTGTLRIDDAATLTSSGGILSGVKLVNAGHLTLPVGTSTLASFIQLCGAAVTVPITAAGSAISPRRPRR